MAQDREREDKETRGRGDKETKIQGDKGTVGLSPCPLVSPSPCLLVSIRSSQRQRHVLLVVSLSLIVKTRPALTTARPDLAWAIGLMLTRANTLSARSVSKLPTRVVSPLPVKRNPPRPHLVTWKSPVQESNCRVLPLRSS